MRARPATSLHVYKGWRQSLSPAPLLADPAFLKQLKSKPKELDE